MFLITMLLLLLSSEEVRVSTLDGSSEVGVLASLTPESLSMESRTGVQTIPLTTILSVDVRQKSPRPPAEDSVQQILLHDQCLINGSSAVRSAQEVRIASAEFGELQIPAAAVRAIRLQPEDPKFAGQWKTFLQREGDKDLLIIPKRSGEGLDFLAGIVSTVTEEQISFLLDGDNIPVPASRVYGIIFASPSRPTAGGTISLHSFQDQLLKAASVESDGSVVQAQTSWGQTIRIPLSQLQRIDFSSGRVRYLSDLPPIREEFMGIDPGGSLFSGLIDRQTAELMYGPRRDSTIDPSIPIRLRGRRFEKGLCIHSKTLIEWALDRRFSSLDALIGVDDEVAFNQVSRVALVISGDGDVLFQRIFKTNEPPVPVQINVQGVSTLSVLVDYGDNDSTCDWLDLADAKLILATEEKQ